MSYAPVTRSNATHQVVDLNGNPVRVTDGNGNPVPAAMSRWNLPAVIAGLVGGMMITATLNRATDTYEATLDGAFLGLDGFDSVVPVAMVVESNRRSRRPLVVYAE